MFVCNLSCADRAGMESAAALDDARLRVRRLRDVGEVQLLEIRETYEQLPSRQGSTNLGKDGTRNARNQVSHTIELLLERRRRALLRIGSLKEALQRQEAGEAAEIASIANHYARDEAIFRTSVLRLQRHVANTELASPDGSEDW